MPARPTSSAEDFRRGLRFIRNRGLKQTLHKGKQVLRQRKQAIALYGRRKASGEHSADVYGPWPQPERAPRLAIRVGVILDDFSRMAFEFEWEQVLLKPSSWREVLESDPVDLVFIESAWAGNGGAWRYHLTGPTAPRPALVELLEFCRERGIVTVFWNKEDPAHFEDFLDTARLCDHVFTSDSNLLEQYRERLGHDRVGALSFAAQPAIHNPVRADGHGPQRDVAFAGMYFAHKYPERCEQLELLLGAAESVRDRMEHGLDIFSRQLGGDDKYQFPAPYASRVVGSSKYPQMLTAYRDYKIFLNVNSVIDSPSMCARRIFEISACGTPVVSAPSAAVGEFFPSDEVFVVSEPDEAAHTIRALVRSSELRDRATHLAQRRIWSEHTYAHRAGQVLSAAGLKDEGAGVRRRSVTALVSTNRPHQVDFVLNTLAQQHGVDLQVALLAHGFEPDWASLKDRAAELGLHNLVTLEAPQSVLLGDCLNLLLDAADGDVVAKVDDDDLYGPEYLSDQLFAMDFSGAQVVGKHAHYMHLTGPGATLLRFPEKEHRFTDFVMGPTIVAERELATSVRFPSLRRGEDTGFLRAVDEAGASIYSTDRFNFVQMRQGDSGHTWAVSQMELLGGATVQFFGRPNEHVMI